MLQLQPFLTRPVRQLSLGQRMRAEVGLAVLQWRCCIRRYQGAGN
jgi:ABC-type uncharacterized transport system ATPase subunit